VSGEDTQEHLEFRVVLVTVGGRVSGEDTQEHLEFRVVLVTVA
jgi:hypothetical protein